MPTPTGLPKAGETWAYRGQPFTVIQRTRGEYWSLRIRWTPPLPGHPVEDWLVDAPWYAARGELAYLP